MAKGPLNALHFSPSVCKGTFLRCKEVLSKEREIQGHFICTHSYFKIKSILKTQNIEAAVNRNFRFYWNITKEYDKVPL